jgi:hypothetical protein
MWYDCTLVEKSVEEIISEADAAIAHAVRVRAHHRRRTDKKSKTRKTDVRLALKRLQEAMKPIRSEIGRFPYLTQAELPDLERARLRATSTMIQCERRKLWKLKQPYRPKEKVNDLIIPE